ncbi:MAG: STAS domain-containing protein [Magnetococcales bacterium]|nr:STAS domain-containing protein [Magnetococcales bacterium]
MFHHSLDDASGTAHLSVTGDLTIRNAAAFKDALSQAMDPKAQTLALDLNEVERVDLTTLQLLCAAHRLLQRQGKNLIIAGTLPATLRESVQMAGFSACGGEHENSGLWTGVKN